MKKILFVFGVLFCIHSMNHSAYAQWAIGASYEVRDEDPENGFGLRLERSILQGMPIINFGIRAHLSYVSTEIDNYDYGLAALVGVKLGVVKPYAGLGIGNQHFNFNAEIDQFDFDESSFYWNGFGGAEVTLFPFLQPFIEYRIANLTGTDDIDFDNVSRLAIGINLRF